MSEPAATEKVEKKEGPVEHINLKVVGSVSDFGTIRWSIEDSRFSSFFVFVKDANEVFFKIKRSTQLRKLMDAYCERQGKQPGSVRFLYDGTRVMPGDTPNDVCVDCWFTVSLRKILKLLI